MTETTNTSGYRGDKGREVILDPKLKERDENGKFPSHLWSR